MLSPGDISFAGDDFEVTSTFATTKAAENPVINQNVEALNNGLLPTNFLDLDIRENLFVIYLIQKYIKLCFEE